MDYLKDYEDAFNAMMKDYNESIDELTAILAEAEDRLQEWLMADAEYQAMDM